MSFATKSSSTRPALTEKSPLLSDPSAGQKKSIDILENAEKLDPEVEREVRVLYLIAVLSGMLLMAISPIKLIYLIYVGYSTSEDVSFFVIISAIDSAVPILTHAGMGALTSYIGVRRTISCIGCTGFTTLIVLASARNSRWIFAGAYTIFCTTRSVFVARMVRMANIVPGDFRTRIMAFMTFSSLLGGTIGPVVWIACSHFPREYHIFSSLYLNRFTLDLFVSSILCLLMAVISWNGLGDSSATPLQNTSHSEENATPDDSNQAALPMLAIEDDGIDIDNDFVYVNLSNGVRHHVNTKSYQRIVFLYFLYLRLSVGIVTGLTVVAFQPILESDYNTSEKDFGVIYTIICAFGVIPPLIVAFISKHMQDRQIILIGLLIKLVGISLSLPIFSIGGEVHRWQVIAGLVLVFKGSMFFWTSATSLFTILLGPMTNGALLGGLSSAAQVGPALAQMFLAKWIIGLFGSFNYAMLLIPTFLAIFIVVWPPIWKILDPQNEFTKILIEQIEAIESKRKNNHAKENRGSLSR